jgi:hypothetical protein
VIEICNLLVHFVQVNLILTATLNDRIITVKIGSLSLRRVTLQKLRYISYRDIDLLWAC